MATKDNEKNIREAFATFLRADATLLALAGGNGESIVHGDINATVPVPGVVFSLFTNPLVPDSDVVFESLAIVSVFHASKPSMLEMLGAIRALCKQSGNMSVTFSSNSVYAYHVAVMQTDDLGQHTPRTTATSTLENVFQGEATLRILWREVAS